MDSLGGEGRALERAVKFDERRKESGVSIDRRRGYMGKSSDAPGDSRKMRTSKGQGIPGSVVVVHVRTMTFGP